MDIAAIITQYPGRFIAQYGHRLTREQRHALASMLACRTAQCGEVVLDCPACHELQTRYRSCGNRSCPRCQHHDTARWLERQRQKLLLVDYFLVTCCCSCRKYWVCGTRLSRRRYNAPPFPTATADIPYL